MAFSSAAVSLIVISTMFYCAEMEIFTIAPVSTGRKRMMSSIGHLWKGSQSRIENEDMLQLIESQLGSMAS